MSQEMIVLAAGAVAWLAVSVLFWRLTRNVSSGRTLLRTLILLVAVGVPLALIAWSAMVPMSEMAKAPAPDSVPASSSAPTAAAPESEGAGGGKKMAAEPKPMPPAADGAPADPYLENNAERPGDTDSLAAERPRRSVSGTVRGVAPGSADDAPAAAAEQQAERDRLLEELERSRSLAAESKAAASEQAGESAAGEAPAAPAPMRPMAVPETAPDMLESARPAPAGAPAPADDDRYSSVPVFYGTDRDRIEGGKHIDYGTGRAKRLELGQAWVTIPKKHHVPGQIERPFEVIVLGYKVYAEKEDLAKHFTVYSVTPLSRDAFLAEVKKRLAASQAFQDHAIVFIHGYNTAFDAALYRSAQITNDLGFDGAPFLYSWPSQGGVGSYETDQNSSEQAQPYLKEFLELVMKESGAKNLTIIAHSMGNVPLLRILNTMQVAATASQSGIRINQIILAAPDVDRDVFETLTRGLPALSDNITLYASANDRAMLASRAYAGGIPRAGDVPETGPVVTQGVDTVDISAISTDILSLNHSDFAERSQLLEDIGKIIQSGLRPPPRREPNLSELSTGAGAYWKFPDKQP